MPFILHKKLTASPFKLDCNNENFLFKLIYKKTNYPTVLWFLNHQLRHHFDYYLKQTVVFICNTNSYLVNQ